MKRIPRLLLLLTPLVVLLSWESYGQIVCDQFNIVLNLHDKALDVTLQTDLPDDTVLMVAVKRSYLQKEDSKSYYVDYLSEKSTVGKWKTKQSVPLDNEKWQQDLKSKQEQMSRLGAGFSVASISEDITVSLTVPYKQSNPKFGEQNSKLSGKCVSDQLPPVVRGKGELAYPLRGSAMNMSAAPSLAPSQLKQGESYIVSKPTALMPEFEPSDSLRALQIMKQIPAQGSFSVTAIKMKGETPWYEVDALDVNGTSVGSGWINSTALIGQTLKSLK